MDTPKKQKKMFEHLWEVYICVKIYLKIYEKYLITLLYYVPMVHNIYVMVVYNNIYAISYRNDGRKSLSYHLVCALIYIYIYICIYYTIALENVRHNAYCFFLFCWI